LKRILEGEGATGEMAKQLKKALDECERLKEENRRLRALLGIPEEKQNQNKYSTNTASFSSRDRIAVFKSFFRGREDVFALRWENRHGRSGYSPACANEWKRPLCEKPGLKCADCENRELLSLTDDIVCDHLSGKHTIGMYPLLPDETCWLLAVDFDKSVWQEDAEAFLKTCDDMGVSAVLERSRSGNGGHVWIFFESPVQASLARKLGSAILTCTMERTRHIGLDSYDRFFPNQDTMPKGGFGNLIALPLQRGPRESGNTLFLDREFEPYADQWTYLSTIKKMKQEEIKTIVYEAQRMGKILGVRMSLTDEASDDPWTLPPSGKREEMVEIEGPVPERLSIVLGNMVYIEKEALPSAIVNQLIRLSAFQNPEFYKAQAMRLSTFGKPRIISCAEDFSRHIGLPRGSLDEIIQVLKSYNINVNMKDERVHGSSVNVEFKGELSPLQKKAAASLLEDDIGVLSAPTAFGKTVIAAYIIANRMVNTIVLVHRSLLLDQWYEQLRIFLDIENIGRIGGGRNDRTGHVDVGMLQSLYRKGAVNDLVAEYGQIIVDECHHISAFSFERVLKQVKARYVTGLTATPIRKDGHHPIIMMQCGPIRFRGDAIRMAQERPFEHVVIPRHTDFRVPEGTGEGIQSVYAALMKDNKRNDLIIKDITKVLAEGRVPLVLTDRIEHLEEIASKLKGLARNVIVLRGGLGKRKLKNLTEQLMNIPEGEERLIVSTGRYIGEGFDYAWLDTLFLTMPVSWRGTIQQYAGRLHRLHTNKKIVRIYDYIDSQVPVLLRMYKRRLKGYKSIGYSIQESTF